MALLVTLGLLSACRETAQPPEREFAIHIARQQEAPGLKRMPDRHGRVWWVEESPRLCCKDFASARLEIDDYNKPLVALSLSAEATPRLAALTREHIGEVMAVLADGKLQMAATVQSEISGGQLALSGFDSLEEAQALLRR